MDKLPDLHIQRLRHAHELAQKNFESTAIQRKEASDEKNRFIPLQIGEKFGELRHYLGMSKIQDLW